MRQRITYLLPKGTNIEPSSIHVGNSDLTFAKANRAAEERRITLGTNDLPEELRVLLDDFHELHIRIVTHRAYEPFPPLHCRLPPGLHASFTPRKPDQDTQLCSALEAVLGPDLKCSNSSASFSKPPILSERFTSSATYQFHHAPYDLRKVSEYLASQALTKQGRWPVIETLSTTFRRTSSFAYIDVDFDAISHAVTVTALTLPNARGNNRDNTLAVRKDDPSDRLEVGILEPQDPDEPEELSLGGYLTVIGEDDHPGATMFSFPSRHHPLPDGDDSSYFVEFRYPTGLHPKLNIVLTGEHVQPPKATCALHAYWTLPSSLFIDRYQLSDSLFLASQNLVALRALSGEEDLEAPDWAIATWGSAALLELSHPPTTSSLPNWTMTIPTHLRYINSTASGDVLSIPWPVVFWACEAEEGLKMGTNPFDRTNLGYDGLFGPKTMFYHVPPSLQRDELVQELNVPTLHPEDAKWVPFGTTVAILVGFAWISWQLLRPAKAAAKEAKVKKTQ